MLRRRPYRRIPPGVLLSFVILVLIILLLVEGLLLAERKIRPAILAAAVMECDNIATMAINKIILEKVVPTVSYKDLISVEQDENGKIVMAQANIVEINRVMALTTAATGEAVTEISDREIKIPLGKITGSYLLAAYGPKIPVRLKPMGRVNTVVFDSFEDAGINQTRHKIYLQVIIEVQIIVPLIVDSVEVFTMVPLADTIYIGEVPEMLVNLYFPSQE
ncbi:MAG TPA: sporulation protein YunB [Bacillota bacterium]|nr:sporulation protein YunB [Bacillota bacterium]HPZ41825.1 sporulation protein YunB [Bacillota bacterium]HQD52694.1 sporulation protein YunB [Bacillota bacterium]